MVGKLIVFEGINGSGKTTLINMTRVYLHEQGYDVSIYKFPNRNGVLGKDIDSYLKGTSDISSKYDVLTMFSKDRSYSKNDILLDLHCGKIVLLDRYLFSGIAYQMNDTNPITDIGLHFATRVMYHFEDNALVPDMVYLVDGDHLHNRNEKKERFHGSNKFDLLRRVILEFECPLQIVDNTNDVKDAFKKIIDTISLN